VTLVNDRWTAISKIGAVTLALAGIERKLIVARIRAVRKTGLFIRIPVSGLSRVRAGQGLS
jgi:hypothetical protein